MNLYSYGAAPTTTMTTTTISTTTKASTSVASATATSTNVWNAQGCYNDSPHLLTALSTSSNSLTTESCQAYCLAAGYTYSGTEYSYQCFCGNTLTSNALTVSTGCTYGCAGNASQICGGSNNINLYKYGPPAATTTTTKTTSAVSTAAPTATGAWYAGGCIADSSGSRALSYSYGSSSSMTNQVCQAGCKALGYVFAGTEYSTQVSGERGD